MYIVQGEPVKRLPYVRNKLHTSTSLFTYAIKYNFVVYDIIDDI